MHSADETKQQPWRYTLSIESKEKPSEQDIAAVCWGGYHQRHYIPAIALLIHSVEGGGWHVSQTAVNFVTYPVPNAVKTPSNHLIPTIVHAVPLSSYSKDALVDDAEPQTPEVSGLEDGRRDQNQLRHYRAEQFIVSRRMLMRMDIDNVEVQPFVIDQQTGKRCRRFPGVACLPMFSD